MKRSGRYRIRAQLPPVTETWQEVSSLHRARYGGPAFLPRYKRWAGLSLMVKHVRVLVSLEEVYGRGLLERFNQQAEQLDSPASGGNHAESSLVKGPSHG